MNKLLIVDDDKDHLESTVSLLKVHNYEVETAKEGIEAVKKYKKIKPNLVLMDINMPIMDGYDAFFQIKNEFPKAKIILMSGFNEHKRLAEAKSKCLIYLLHKPYSVNFLLELIDQNLKKTNC